jgi:Na+/proline symporter
LASAAARKVEPRKKARDNRMMVAVFFMGFKGCSWTDVGCFCSKLVADIELKLAAGVFELVGLQWDAVINANRSDGRDFQKQTDANVAVEIARIVFIIFLILFVISLIMHLLSNSKLP